MLVLQSPEEVLEIPHERRVWRVAVEKVSEKGAFGGEASAGSSLVRVDQEQLAKPVVRHSGGTQPRFDGRPQDSEPAKRPASHPLSPAALRSALVRPLPVSRAVALSLLEDAAVHLSALS
ncbi:hypothetical protein HK096_005390 [Nowakowskiella sp. JEL0078]|nr:hypothetical protein HK096_005390 [Nowakowskiella sp. JEL0078]